MSGPGPESGEPAALSNEAIVAHLHGCLDHLGIRSRKMFGGYGLYFGEKFFGLVNYGAAWFRTDEESRPGYVSRGMPPFQPKGRPVGPRTSARNFRVPDDVLADPDLLAAWALRAFKA